MSEPFELINEDAQCGGELSGSQSSMTNGDSQRPSESAFPDEDEDTITMLDVIEREDELEEEASAVLGAGDEKNCTYPKGYIPRQALYSCATCFDVSNKQAAICLACSLECHENHEVYELYTKRNYRCDCGNSKFKPDFECKLMEKQLRKAPLNENNKYNHNFSGRYCTCDKRYPPDENDEENSDDEMWQCIVCEDWYHTKHLGAKELPTKFDELICGPCVEKLDFVHHYKNIEELAPTPEESTVTNTQTTYVVNENNSNQQKAKDSEGESQAGKSSTDCEAKPTSEGDDTTQKDQESQDVVGRVSGSANPACESDTNDSQLENKDPIKSSVSPSVDRCILESLKRWLDSKGQAASNSSDSKQTKKGPLFWSDCGWREKLCRCQKCMDMYKTKDCEYLLDDKDTVQYYEAQGKAMASKNGTPFERGMTALNRMNRVAVVEALNGYEELKADLSDYLKKFADTKKVVRTEDIHEFFQQLKSKKRPRLE